MPDSDTTSLPPIVRACVVHAATRYPVALIEPGPDWGPDFRLFVLEWGGVNSTVRGVYLRPADTKRASAWPEIARQVGASPGDAEGLRLAARKAWGIE